MKSKHGTKSSPSTRSPSARQRAGANGRGSSPGSPVRYAVIGLGHIAQVAVLPAFRNAKRNSHLVALLSDDDKKLRVFGQRYRVPQGHRGGYDQLESIIESSAADAVYIALPNHLHHAFTLRAAAAGCHVLVEKPMAVTEDECEAMLAAAAARDVKLMVAYRLHFEESNLRAIQHVQDRDLGEPRLIAATFTIDVQDDANIRWNVRAQGGGPLYDLGVYCINAARYLLRAEPVRVSAAAVLSPDRRRRDPEEGLAAILHFPGERLASFTVSFGSSAVSELRIVGTKGDLRVENAFEYKLPMTHHLTVDERTKRRKFRKRDQFAPELLYFSDCIQRNRPVEPSAREGLADVRVVRALHAAADSGRAVELAPFTKRRRPDMRQEIHRPAHGKPKTVGVKAASEG